MVYHCQPSSKGKSIEKGAKKDFFFFSNSFKMRYVRRKIKEERLSFAHYNNFTQQQMTDDKLKHLASNN